MLAIEGILSATTNYLLDAMTTQGFGFDAALRQAQSGGFAEADPRNDTEGWDTACKLLILADAMGETLAIGSGAEPLATAAAALKDLEHILAARAAWPASCPQPPS